MTPPRRNRIGKWTSLVARETAYVTADAVEVDSSEFFELVRRRVLFDDIRLVTLHRMRGTAYLLVTGIFALFLTTIAGVIAAIGGDAWAAALVFFMFAALPLTLFILRLTFGVDVVTVFGRRSRVALRFQYRKERAREVYGMLCASAYNAQRVRTPAPMEVSAPESAEPPLPPDVPLPPL